MRSLRNRPATVATVLGAFILLSARPGAPQEGFPLDGTWRGAWGDPTAANHVVLVMKWNGETVTGLINPGPEAVDFDYAELMPENWTIRIEATSAAGEPIVIDGTLSDIGSHNRSIDGIWTQAGVAYPFRISRQ